MNSEIRTCQNCKQNFTIEAEDFQFYEKIKVPAPTWCPECRFIRRLTWRNERVFYKRKCGLCQKPIIAASDENSAPVVYCQTCWWSDNWDPLQYGRDYDFSRTFFEQFADLYRSVPQINLWSFSNGENCDYANLCAYSKDAYLSISAVESEYIYYTVIADKSFNCMDSYGIYGCTLCYEVIDASRCNNCSFLINSRECADSDFLFDCANCQNCFMSSNLRNKQYYIRNKKYSKEDYVQEMERINKRSYASHHVLRKEFEELVLKSLHKYANIIKSVDITGDHMENAKNCRDVWYGQNLEDSSHCWRTRDSKNVYDITGMLFSELMYEVSVGGDKNYNAKFCMMNKGLHDCDYAILSPDSRNVFGCVGMKNGRYAILNKTYGESEFKELRSRIIEQMNLSPYTDRLGRMFKYGEYFPPALSPWAYNETVAQEYFPLDKESAEKSGYAWKEARSRENTSDIASGDLPDLVDDSDKNLLGKIIGCKHHEQNKHEFGCKAACTLGFKMIPQEIEMYKKIKVPLPRVCPNCRHYERLRRRNPLKLWKRRCMCLGLIANSVEQGAYVNTVKHFHGDNPCPNEFETSYGPDRPEIVYCEHCYQTEVV